MTTNAPMQSGGQGERWFLRFNYFHRFLHVLIMISFLGLVLTGMPLKFHTSGWARALAGLLGGIENAGYLHRVFGIITFMYFILHLLYAAHYIL